MIVDVRAFGLTVSDALQQHIDTRINATLRPFLNAVTSITARLTDINAGRGGIDKKCSIVAVVRQHGSVVVEGLHSDPYGSIDQACGRMRRALSRTINRGKRHEQRHCRRSDAIPPQPNSG